jgi:dolichyl-phosphate beta-glucosyltransferase
MSGSPDVSLVLPAYRAGDVLQRSLPVLTQYLSSAGFASEVLIVDDGSEDGGRTSEVAARFGCRYLALSRNMGKGCAVRQGMLAARGRFRLYTDADVPFELEALGTAVRYLDVKEFHVVAGDRNLVDSQYTLQVSFSRRCASAVCSAVVGGFIATGWYDTQCGLKGFQAEVADDIFRVARIDRFAFDVELFYVALKRNYDIKRIPVRLRSNETSSVRLAIDGPAFARDLFRIRWNQFCGRYGAGRVFPRH